MTKKIYVGNLPFSASDSEIRTMFSEFGTVESVKAVSDLFAPVSGEVIEVNETLEDSPELVNADCYGDGWILAIDETDDIDLEDLMDASAYRRHIEERED